MYSWGNTSETIRKELCPELQKLVDLMLSRSDFDMSIICGYRDKLGQDTAYNTGKSKAKFGESAHNYYPARAVDIIPCGPIDWDIRNPRWRKMTDNAKECAQILGIEIVCGIDFKSFCDAPHIEMKNWRKA